MPHLAAFITPHGYGHAAIVSAVLNALWRGHPDLRVTIVSRVPETVLRQRLDGPFEVLPHAGATDFGMLMTSSIGVRRADSLAAYVQAHHDWPDVVAAEAAILRRLRPDLVISCAGYACLAAAAGQGIPALGLGPFTWDAVLRAYVGDRPEAPSVLARMREAYESATTFLETTPAVPTGLSNARPVGPVGTPATPDTDGLRRRLGMAPGDRLALLAMGGLPESLDLSAWPATEGVRWLSGGPVSGDSARLATPVEEMGIGVSEAVAASDVVVTKPGYGTFVEAASAGTAVIYRERPDWPETAGLDVWVRAHVPTHRIDDETFFAGGFLPQLQKMVQAPRRPLGWPSGNDEIAVILRDYL